MSDTEIRLQEKKNTLNPMSNETTKTLRKQAMLGSSSFAQPHQPGKLSISVALKWELFQQDIRNCRQLACVGQWCAAFLSSSVRVLLDGDSFLLLSRSVGCYRCVCYSDFKRGPYFFGVVKN